MERQPVVSVILGTYNRKPGLVRCVNAVPAAVEGLSFEVVAADGGSNDGSREWLERQPHARIVEGGRTGAVQAFNAAFAAARGHYVAVLNDDCFPRPGCIARGVAALRENKNAGQAALAMVSPHRPTPYVNILRRTFLYANYNVIPAAMARAVADIQDGGFWWPGYHTYGADCELSCWIQKLGWSVIPCMDAVVEDEPLDDELRRHNTREDLAQRRQFWLRWGRRLEVVAPDHPFNPHMDEDCKSRFFKLRDMFQHGSPLMEDLLNRARCAA